MPDFSDQVKTQPVQFDLTGQTIGRFLILERLGAGGMGEVYRAVDSRLQRTVAIKRMSWRQGLTAADHELFLREGQRASALNHPNIAGVYDVLDANDEVLLVMEYVEGSTLRGHIGEPMPLDRFFEIAIQCASALNAAHENGILHGDVKPENIMLGITGQVKLLDFGVARRLPTDHPDGRTATLPTLSAHGNVSGTPAYMPPEVLKGDIPDARADIFALGLVFYEMLAGRHPFQGLTTTVTTAHILDDREAATLDRAPVKISPRVASVVARALMKDPAQRYSSARELRADLETVSQGGEPSRKLPRSAAAWRWFLLSAIAVLAAAAIFTFRSRIAAFWPRHTQSAPAAAAAPQATPILAVLPPKIDGDNAELRAFADGLSSTVGAKLSALSENHEINIIDSAEIRNATGSSPEQTLSGLGANLTLQLTVQQSGSMNRATYKLADASTARVLAEKTLTAPRSDPFSLEDGVTDGVVRGLQIELRPEEKAAISTHGTTEPVAYDYFLEASGYLDNLDRPEYLSNAIQVLDTALKLDPSYGRAIAKRGEAYWYEYEATKKPDWVTHAKKDCNQAVSLGNAGANGHICMGLVAAGTGDDQLAASEYEKAVELDRTSDIAYVGLANTYARLNRLSDAERTYQQAIGAKPDSRRAYDRLGTFYLQQAEYTKAIDLFQKAIRFAPESDLEYTNLGAAYLFLGNYGGAINALEKSIQLRPTAGAYSNLGTAYYQSRRFAEAARNYQASLKLGDQDADLWGNLADAYNYSGQRPKAIEAYRKQLDLLKQQLVVNPQDAERQGDVASCYASLGDKQNATAHLSRSLELGRGNKDLLFNAAVVYNDLGETGVALEWLQKAFTAGYSPSIARDSPDFDNLRNNIQFQQLMARTQGN